MAVFSVAPRPRRGFIAHPSGTCALALSGAGSNPFDGPHRGIGQQAFEALLDSQRRENSDEGVQRNALSFFEPSYGPDRDAGFLSELLLRHVAGKPDALHTLAESGLDLAACC
jgi:hypothetical protein